MKMSRCDLFSVGAVVNSPLAVPNFCQAPSSPGEEPSGLSTSWRQPGRSFPPGMGIKDTSAELTFGNALEPEASREPRDGAFGPRGTSRGGRRLQVGPGNCICSQGG